VLRPERQPPHLVSSSSDSNILLHHFQITWPTPFQGGLWIHFQERDALPISEFTPVYLLTHGYHHLNLQSLRCHLRIPRFWHTRVNLTTPWFMALSISGRIHLNLQPSQLSVFWQFSRLRVQWWHFHPLNIPWCVSDCNIVTGFKRTSKYSLHPQIVSPSVVSTTPFLSVMDLAALDLLTRKRRMVCQNTLVTCQ